MNLIQPKLGQILALIIKDCVRAGETVELDGLGRFEPGRDEGLAFLAESAPRVFIAYVEEEAVHALRLAEALASAGLNPWMDKLKLLPGQNWKRAIDRAIERSDFFVPCFSELAVRKRGQFPRELRTALRCAEKIPLDDAFIMPVRLSPCNVPQQFQAHYQYLDLFPDWHDGIDRLTTAIWDEFAARLDR